MNFGRGDDSQGRAPSRVRINMKPIGSFEVWIKAKRYQVTFWLELTHAEYMIDHYEILKQLIAISEGLDEI